MAAIMAATVTTALAQNATTFVETYYADLIELDSSRASGWVLVFVTPLGLMGTGSGYGLEANLPPQTSCVGVDNCGSHIYDGKGCADATLQGNSYYLTEMGVINPWGYKSTDAQGSASYAFSVITTKRDIAGKPFIVHNNAGARVACGVLSQRSDGKVAQLNPLDSSSVYGNVVMFASNVNIVGAGYATGLEPNLADTQNGGASCAADMGCGTHVHNGSNCGDSIGAHLSPSIGDPWRFVRYGTTDANGRSQFQFTVNSNRTDVVGKPFIVHNNVGGKVACGLISASVSPSTPPGEKMSWGKAGIVLGVFWAAFWPTVACLRPVIS
jgi:hypothetical protein